MTSREYVQTIVIGGGQAGLTMGYHLRQRALPFVILDANQRVGDSWRQRWDSLRLFTAARYDGLDGMPFPAPGHSFPTKDEMGDYLERYAERFELPVRHGARVTRLSRVGSRFLLETDAGPYEADDVVVAMAPFQKARTPLFARELNPEIRQLHSSEYANPSQLQNGPALVVGAGNSGAEIALELAAGRGTVLAGDYTGVIPFRIETRAGRILIRFVLRGLFHRATIRTPIGRKLRSKFIGHGQPLVRTKPADLEAAGVRRVGRVTGVHDGRPALQSGETLDVANVVWCTGFRPGFDWIDLPVFAESGWPQQERGVVHQEPGLYFSGLPFIYAASSAMPHGLGRDARFLARAIEGRTRNSVERTGQRAAATAG